MEHGMGTLRLYAIELPGMTRESFPKPTAAVSSASQSISRCVKTALILKAVISRVSPAVNRHRHDNFVLQDYLNSGNPEYRLKLEFRSWLTGLDC
jgi:hypothetical protein